MGGSGISLRGLGAGSTLVLLNGRRIAPYGLADDGQKIYTDLSVIPLEAVERVEVLKDGASAIYGSDAIAGVVNVYADAGPIEKMARARVCERHGSPCKERLGRVLRTPFFHELDFTDGGRSVTVRCSRQFVFVGDQGYGTHELARFARRHARRLTLVSKFHADANLHAPPPPYAGKGRPRRTGRSMPGPPTSPNSSPARRTSSTARAAAPCP